jgi:hypothetical protein
MGSTLCTWSELIDGKITTIKLDVRRLSRSSTLTYYATRPFSKSGPGLDLRKDCREVPVGPVVDDDKR